MFPDAAETLQLLNANKFHRQLRIAFSLITISSSN